MAASKKGPVTLRAAAMESSKLAPELLGAGGRPVVQMIPTLRNKKAVSNMLEVWKGKMTENKAQADLAEAGGYFGLLELLDHSLIGVKNQALEAMLGLVRVDTTKDGPIGIIDPEKVIPLNKLLFQAHDPIVKEKTLWDIATMASIPQCRRALAEKIGMDAAVKFLRNDDAELRAAAATFLANMAYTDEYKNFMLRNEDVITQLVKAQRGFEPTPKVICSIAFAFSVFGAQENGALEIADKGGLECLKPLLKYTPPDNDIIRTAVGAFAALSAHDALQSRLNSLNLMQEVIDILKTNDDDFTLQLVTQIVLNLTRDEEACNKFIDCGGLLTLQRLSLVGGIPEALTNKRSTLGIAQLTTTAMNVQLRVTNIFKHLVLANDKCKEAVKEEKDAIHALRNLERSEHEKVARAAAEVLDLLGLERFKYFPEELEERKRTQEEEERRRGDEEEERENQRRAAEEERERKLRAEEEERRRKQEEEERRRKQEEDDKRRKQEEDRKRKEEEDRRRKDEEDRKRKEEEDKKRRQEEDDRRRRQEEDDRRRKQEELERKLEDERKKIRS